MSTLPSTPFCRIIDAVATIFSRAYMLARARPAAVRPSPTPTDRLAVATDNAYDLPRARRAMRRRRGRAVTPEKRKPHSRKPGRPARFDADAYRRRNAIKRWAGWIKNL